MYTGTRDREVQILKKLWLGERVVCPKCGQAELTYLHKKAKKSSCDWVCPACGEIYRTIRMLRGLSED